MSDIPTNELPTTVESNVPCMGCGYNLRTLQTSSNCPECNTPVANSMRGDWLYYSPPVWLNMLYRGTTIILVSYLLFIAGMITTAFSQMLEALVMLASSVCGFWGAWLLTTPEPRETFAQQSVNLRKGAITEFR